MNLRPDPGIRSWQRSATEDLWERTLSQIPTKFGRLAYLARLRSPETDCYEHHGLIAIFGETEAESALRNSHCEILDTFLALSLLDQKSDVEGFARGLPQSVRRVLEAWDRSHTYVSFLPPAASSAQRGLFEANLRLIVKHLLREAEDGADRKGP